VIQPKEPKGAEPIVYEKAFTIMAPEITTVDPSSGSTPDEIEISGNYFGTKKGKVYLMDSVSGRRKICRITEEDWGMYELEVGQKACRVKEWTMNPTTGVSTLRFVVFRKLRAGTYGVEVVNKVGRATAVFTVN
jgi:hypothetical protein